MGISSLTIISDDEVSPGPCCCCRSLQAAVTCDECQAAAQDFVSHLLTEESIAEQVQLMKDNVCPQLGMDGCEGILDMWYADMATCIFNHFILESDACSLAGLCYEKSAMAKMRDWTCEECTMLMSGLADFMVQEETITEGVAYLQGECFCGAEGHTDDCPALVEAVVPLAMPVLAAAVNEKAVEHCQEIAGVC